MNNIPNLSSIGSMRFMASIPDIPAKCMYEKLGEQIKNFEDELDENQEVGASLVSFNNSTVFHITGLGYHGKDMIIFYGFNEAGNRLTLLQHISQLNVLLIAMPRLDESKPPRRIGFIIENEESTEE